jgi:imidazolonepropionase-like amidohydrolase
MVDRHIPVLEPEKILLILFTSSVFVLQFLAIINRAVMVSYFDCTDGELIAEELAEEDFPVFVGPSLGHKSKIELANKSFTTPGVLNRAGLTVSIITDAPVIPLRYLPMCSGLAVNSGLDRTEAWKAITINPAVSLGVADRVGSLEVGKDADVVIWTADPLSEIGGEAWCTIIDGQIVYRRG